MTIVSYTNMLYEVTITLLPYVFNTALCVEEQFHMTREMVLLLFEGKPASIVVEVANGKVHYHALTDFVDHRAINRFRYKLRKQVYLGRTSVSQVVDEPAWRAYLKKDLLNTYKLLNVDGLLRDDYDVEHSGNVHDYFKYDLHDHFYIDEIPDDVYIA